MHRAPRRLSARATLLSAAGIALVVGAAVAVVAAARSPGDQLDARVTDVVRAGAPGVLVRIRDGDDVRTIVSGLAENEPDRPLADGDRFRIGSVTKTFVATVVLQLVAEGRLGLDDAVERWVPGVVAAGERITIRHLLGHRSGLFDYVDDPRVFAPYAHRPRHVWRPRTLIALAESHPMTFAPGERYGYSSTNYLLLGLIVEATSRRPLVEELRARIFGPLRLRATSFEPLLVSGVHVHGYRPPSHQGVVTGAPRDTSGEVASWAWAAGAMVSTAADLDRFFTALLGGRLLPPAMLREMESARPAGSLRYGLGLAVFPTPCEDAWGHTGNARGTITVAWSRRDGSRQVVVAVNVFPLTGALEDAIRRLQDAAFCGGS